jgi:predicted DNA-binding transcriptional regulator AlpA
MLEKLWTVQELASYCRVEIQTVYNWRSAGEGPQGISKGKFVLFKESSIQDWIESWERA